MILVDTAVWIDHLHASDDTLVSLLDQDRAGTHPMVIEELALGSMKNRARVLRLLGNLWKFPVLSHVELLALVDHHRLAGRGVSATDAHLLGSVLLVPGAQLWTRDKALQAAATEASVAFM